ncbi:hypothetical protein MKX03_020906 [Papaver bracteatum]|nr:hypothetical protein MKX03_020906 [Papaver bracteatum]
MLHWPKPLRQKVVSWTWKGWCLFRSYKEMQRKLCSDGKTWKGDGLVVNRLRRSNNGVEYVFHVFT